MIFEFLQRQHSRQTLFALLLFNLLLRVALALFLPVTYKEAYFWEWSRYFDWGYLDHPPMVAWLIGLTSFLPLDPTAFLIRLPSLLLGTCSLFLIYKVALEFFQDTSLALHAAFIATCVPVLNAVGFLILPDSPLIFFQLLFLLTIAKLFREPQWWMWGVLGVVLGLALLSKFMILFSILGLALFLLSDTQKKPSFLPWILSGLFAFTLSLPYLFWSSAHGWENLRLQFWERHFWDFGWTAWKGFEYSFEQVAAAGPLLFLPFLFCFFLSAESLPLHWQRPYRFLRLQSVTILLLLFIAGSFITQTHPHWTVLAYPSACILLALFWQQAPQHFISRHLPQFLKITQVCFAGFVVVLMILPQLVVHIPPEYLGWRLGSGLIKGRQRLWGFPELCRELEVRMDALHLDPQSPLFSDGYQISAPLSFAWQKSPVISLPAYFQEKKGLGHAQAFYIPPSSLEGTRGLYLSRSQGPWIEKRLSTQFKHVEPLPPLRQEFGGKVIGEYSLYLVEGLLSREEAKLQRGS